MKVLQARQCALTARVVATGEKRKSRRRRHTAEFASHSTRENLPSRPVNGRKFEMPNVFIVLRLCITISKNIYIHQVFC